MLIRVDFVQENDGVSAIVANMPSLQAFGATQEEAVGKVLSCVAAHYNAKIGSVQFVLEEAATPAPAAGPLTNEELRALAKKHKPPASWFDEEQPVL